MRERAGTELPVPALFVFSVLVALAAFVSSCTDICSNEVIASALSPDGRYDAIIFQRDCGATTGFSTQISIVQHGDIPTASGNIFVADDDHGVAAAGAWGGPRAEVQWESADRLLVLYARGSRIFKQDRSRSGITVSYRSVRYPSPRT